MMISFFNEHTWILIPNAWSLYLLTHPVLNVSLMMLFGLFIAPPLFHLASWTLIQSFRHYQSWIALHWSRPLVLLYRNGSSWGPLKRGLFLLMTLDLLLFFFMGLILMQGWLSLYTPLVLSAIFSENSLHFMISDGIPSHIQNVLTAIIYSFSITGVVLLVFYFGHFQSLQAHDRLFSLNCGMPNVETPTNSMILRTLNSLPFQWKLLFVRLKNLYWTMYLTLEDRLLQAWLSPVHSWGIHRSVATPLSTLDDVQCSPLTRALQPSLMSSIPEVLHESRFEAIKNKLCILAYQQHYEHERQSAIDYHQCSKALKTLSSSPTKPSTPPLAQARSGTKRL